MDGGVIRARLLARGSNAECGKQVGRAGRGDLAPLRVLLANKASALRDHCCPQTRILKRIQAVREASLTMGCNV